MFLYRTSVGKYSFPHSNECEKSVLYRTQVGKSSFWKISRKRLDLHKNCKNAKFFLMNH